MDHFQAPQVCEYICLLCILLFICICFIVCLCFFYLNKDFIIAWTIFGNKGLVLDIKNSGGGSIFFDMNFFSSYTNEDEKLYIANNNILEFSNIHNIPLKVEYKVFIKNINIMKYFIEGFPLTDIKPSSEDVSVLNGLI